MKINFLLFLIICILGATESPFDIKDSNDSIIVPSDFQREDLRFNSNARILKSITLTYINLDGSEDSMKIDINKSINWHNNYALIEAKSPDASRILDVSVTIPEKNNLKEGEINSTLNIEIPIQAGNIYDFVAYSIYKNKIKINTNNEMLSDFSIDNPTKIVIDFKFDKILPSKNIKFSKKSPFQRIDFGSHDGYYRIVVYLDGKYNYNILKDSNGYIINLI